MSDIELDRERVIQTLCAHFANDNLTTQELELRFEHAYAAHTPAELHALVMGLPALPRDMAPPAPFYGVSNISPESIPEKRHLVVMSNLKKKGVWTPARHNVVNAIMGAAKFDLREANLLHGETHFELFAFMGEIELIVPPGLRIEADGFAFMGEFEDLHSAELAQSDAPVLRITGTVIMGAVRIKTRLPGESSLAAWRRRRLEGSR